MSNAVTSHVIDYGHQVIVYTRRSQMQAIWVTRGDTVQSPYGYYKHDEMVGVKYGQKVGVYPCACAFQLPRRLTSSRAQLVSSHLQTVEGSSTCSNRLQNYGEYTHMAHPHSVTLPR